MVELILMGSVFLVMYFFMIRPQVKRQKEQNKFRSELKKGDQIITTGGIYGKIIEVKESTVILENYGVKIKVHRSCIERNSVSE
jgi:preprotein translocase subunit YajC